jgi:hypothetical protein
MATKRFGIAVVVLLVLSLGWVATSRFVAGDPLTNPVDTRGPAAIAERGEAAVPGAPSAEVERTAPPAADSAVAASVFGRVVDAASGAPVAAATVALFDFAAQVHHRVETDDQGRYAFPISRGRTDAFRLAIDKAGAGRLVVPDVRAAIAARRDELRSGLLLHGRVQLASGAAVPAGCRILAIRLPFLTYAERNKIELLRRQTVPPEHCIDRETTTAADGTFLLSDLQSGRHALVVVAAGHQPLVHTGGKSFDPFAGCEAAPATTAPAIEIVLPAVGSAYVEVIDAETAEPLHGAQVTASAKAGELWLPLTPIAAEPASPHRFRVPVDLDARGRIDDMEVHVSAPGRAAQRISPGGQYNGHTFVIPLDRPASVLGTVRGDDGAPIAGAPVLIRDENDHRLVGSAHTDGLGAFAIGELAPGGPLSLVCLRPERSAVLATVALRLAAGETRRVDIGPGVAGALTGRVAVLGRPDPDASVDLYCKDAKVDVGCSTDDDGTFAFAALPTGSYEVLVQITVNGRVLGATRHITIGTAPVHLDFDFAHRLTGIVRFEGGEPGAPAPDGEIKAQRVDAADVSERVDIGPDGRFELLVVTAATYDVSFDAGIGWVTIHPPRVDLRLGEAPPVDVRVMRDACDATIELRVTDAADGSPASGHIYTRHRNSQGVTNFEDGIHLEEQAGIGVHRFRVFSDAHAPTTIEIEVTALQKRVVRDVPLERARGVEVSEVTAGAPGHRAGLQKGDQILRYGQHEIASLAQLRACIAAATGIVALVVRREGSERTLDVEAGKLGIEIENLR